MHVLSVSLAPHPGEKCPISISPQDLIWKGESGVGWNCPCTAWRTVGARIMCRENEEEALLTTLGRLALTRQVLAKMPTTPSRQPSLPAPPALQCCSR